MVASQTDKTNSLIMNIKINIYISNSDKDTHWKQINKSQNKTGSKGQIDQLQM